MKLINDVLAKSCEKTNVTLVLYCKSLEGSQGKDVQLLDLLSQCVGCYKNNGVREINFFISPVS